MNTDTDDSWVSPPLASLDDAETERIESRARHLLPEEEAAGSDDPVRQAETILDDSDRREADPNAAPDTILERRTSAETAPTPEPPG
ncbi:hypothetical protein O7632_25210 [Solwaraspora sp. WMMD406]|uniref:hypothetical protein n=1 Tax=Solwaraspora sp. WMMD406 TaxID=3016095 RepID=UPI00241762BA|nr:hypothetical protein [Solwaraspora sp. WMMD406]MDG4767364.1 hypothetical protein [Solwaraspora sp. WMMD406]